jgi:hypothetical protein
MKELEVLCTDSTALLETSCKELGSDESENSFFERLGQSRNGTWNQCRVVT